MQGVIHEWIQTGWIGVMRSMKVELSTFPMMVGGAELAMCF